MRTPTRKRRITQTSPAGGRNAAASLALSCLFGVLALRASGASAQTCDCPPLTPAGALERASAVFEGQALGGEASDGPQSALSFAVVRGWKGVTSERVSVLRPAADAGCAYPFAPGTTYLVYASGPADALRADLCSRTRPVIEAEEDLRVLGAGVVPVDPEPRDGRPILAVPPAAPPGQGGCAGCRIGGATRSPSSGLWLAAVASTMLWRRRRRVD